MSISRLEFIYIHFSRQDFRLRNSVILAYFAKSRKVYEVFFFAIAYFYFCKKAYAFIIQYFFLYVNYTIYFALGGFGA